VHREQIQLVVVAVLNNDGRGITVEAGWDLHIAEPTVVDSGTQGMVISH
jgi:hypothetical protein